MHLTSLEYLVLQLVEFYFEQALSRVELLGVGHHKTLQRLGVLVEVEIRKVAAE